MKRNEHVFQFSGTAIAEAARGEAEYHGRRMEFWEKEQQTAKAQAGSASVATREYDVTGGKRVELVIDQSVAARLTECTNKIAQCRAGRDRPGNDCAGR